MSFKVTFFKDRQKFSAAHFTIFADGDVERLHGHNYTVSVSFHGENLKGGLLFPFHLIKPEIKRLCDNWDERVLLPGRSKWVELRQANSQVEVLLRTSKVEKFYSFPAQDVIVLECNNVSCENLAYLLGQFLTSTSRELFLPVNWIEVELSESAGQTVCWSQKIEIQRE